MKNPKKIIITGSSRGIGLEIAKHFSSLGSKIVVNSRNISELRSAVKGFDNIFPIAADLSNEIQAKSFIEESVQTLEGLDLLICNAGGGR